MSFLYEAIDIHKSYVKEEPVLKGATLSLKHGEAVALLGASGSGKSTFLHCLGLLDSVDSGKLLFEGTEMTPLHATAMAQFRLAKLGFVFQFHHLIPELSALENVLLPAELAGKKEKDWALELLARVGIPDKRDRFPWQLSGGECQRVAVARALVNRPTLLLTDEATGNLDFERASEIVALLLELSRSTKATLLSVTHDENLASRYQRRYRLKDGAICDWV